MADGVKKINEYILKDGRVIAITVPDYPAEKLEPGTLFVNSREGELKYVNGKSNTKTWTKFVPSVLFDSQTIITSLLKDKSVTTPKLDDYAVTTVKIKDANITTSKYANLSVTSDILGNDSVNRNKIKNLEVITSKLAEASVVESKLGPSSVTRSKIKDGEIFNNHISVRKLKNTVLEEKVLTNTEIKDRTLINSLYGDESVNTRVLGPNSVTEVKIANESVTHNKLGRASVYGDKIKPGSIDTAHIGAINGSKLVDSSIATSKLIDLSVTTAKIANSNVTFAKLEQSTQTLINEAIRVKATQVIAGQNVANTAYCKGNMRIRMEGGQATLKVDGSISATGNITGAKVFNPVFADIAEGYVALEKLTAGDAVCISKKGNLIVEKMNKDNWHRFIGFVSNEYAACYGATPDEIEKGSKVPVALIGRITISKKSISEKFRNEIYLCDRLVIANGEIILSSTATSSAIGKVIGIQKDSITIQVFPS